MGKLHDDWKQAKANAKGVDTKALFKSNLGAALDKFDEVWVRLRPALQSKIDAGTLTVAECDAALKIIDPLVDKATKTAFAYEDAIKKEALKIKTKWDKTTGPKEKTKLGAASQQCKLMLAAITEINFQLSGEGLLWLRKTKSKLT